MISVADYEVPHRTDTISRGYGWRGACPAARFAATLAEQSGACRSIEDTVRLTKSQLFLWRLSFARGDSRCRSDSFLHDHNHRIRHAGFLERDQSFWSEVKVLG